MNIQTDIQPIINFPELAIVKVPSLPNLSNLTILHSNSCGVTVKGSSTIGKETTVFSHVISCQTPVVLVSNPPPKKQEIISADNPSQNLESGDNKENNSIQSDNNMSSSELNTDTQSTETVNSVIESTQVTTAQKEVVKSTPNFARPAGQFSTKEFAELNKIGYPTALAYLKTNAKSAGNRPQTGRGRPTALFTF